MVDRPFISPAQAARIQRLRRRAGLTSQVLQDPPATIQLMRRDPVTGEYGPLGTPTQLITLAIDPALTSAVPSQNGRITVTHGGRASAFAPFDVAVDDRFWWQGYRCTVDSVDPTRNGRVAFTFSMVEVSP